MTMILQQKIVSPYSSQEFRCNDKESARTDSDILSILNCHHFWNAKCFRLARFNFVVIPARAQPIF